MAVIDATKSRQRASCWHAARGPPDRAFDSIRQRLRRVGQERRANLRCSDTIANGSARGDTVAGVGVKTADPGRRAHLPGLDGLRAIAIIGVLLFHADVHAAVGGFLGVDLFFVISGFLITSLLLSEARRDGHIALGRFYLRRARRLLPALFAMLAVAVAFMAVFFRGDLGQARGDVAAALGYVSNWWFVVHHRSYFVAVGRPSPFQHLWSLAVEEQFYLIWPVVLIALLAMRARLRWIAVVAGAGALASAWWMRALSVKGNVPFDTDSSRVYFGTDTHASALLIGASAAAIMAGLANRSGRLDKSMPTFVRAGLDLVGFVGLAALCWSMHAFDFYTPGLYRGGFLAFAAIAVVVVATASAPGSWLGRALDVAPMRWIGTRSYGLYLWHWPVFVYTRPGLDWPLTGTAALVVRLGITVVLTELSYRLVEVPMRRGRSQVAPLVRPVQPARPLLVTLRAAAPVLGAVLGVVAVVGTTTFVSGRIARTPSRVQRTAAAPVGVYSSVPMTNAPAVAPQPAASHLVSSPPPSVQSTDSVSSPPESVIPVTHVTPPSRATHAASPAVSTRPPAIPTGATPPTVSAVGDSVMLDAAKALQLVCPGTEVYAVVGWQAKSVFAEIAALRAAAHLGTDVVIETGTNGIVSSKELDAVLTELGDRQKVVVVNNHMARPWEPPNNAMFPAVVKAHPNAVLVNWDIAANTHPTWLTADGVHLKMAGRAPYAALVKTALAC
jgi:peptidoglycan/LPS O-acetylase OafA/YrhL